MFDLYDEPFDEDGKWDSEGGVVEYCSGLMQAFAESPEGEAYCNHNGHIGWTHSFLYYSLAYLGTLPQEMSQRDINEVLFDLIPRKVSTDSDSATEIISELRAFWEFLEREYQLDNAPSIVAFLDASAEKRLEQELDDPANYVRHGKVDGHAGASGWFRHDDAGGNERVRDGVQRVAARQTPVSCRRPNSR
ncbi:MAG: hypothetical protein CMJ64_06395 [Planctomycetaceae bacterium]|nr:hypothetical protein [Planctomycetaceae bacterium]